VLRNYARFFFIIFTQTAEEQYFQVEASHQTPGKKYIGGRRCTYHHAWAGPLWFLVVSDVQQQAVITCSISFSESPLSSKWDYHGRNIPVLLIVLDPMEDVTVCELTSHRLGDGFDMREPLTPPGH
jgi:hypothetical protein